jgi:hypothetical protein
MDQPSSQPSTSLLVTQKKPAAASTPSAVGLSASAGGSSTKHTAGTSHAPSNNGAFAVAARALVAKEGVPWPSFYDPWSVSITMCPMGQHQQQNRGPAQLLQVFMAAPHTYGAPLMPPGFSLIDTAWAAGRA